MIKWLNSLTISLVESSSVATYLTTGQRKKTDKKQVRVATNVYLRKMLEKPKRGLQILKKRVRELFTHREGISTTRVHHKRRQPLIECAKRDFKIIYYYYYYYYYFESTRAFPLLLRILRCNGEIRHT